MLEEPASMTVLKLQRLPSLPKMDSEQGKARQSDSPRTNGISFSVAALLADTRPRRSPTPVVGTEEPDDDDLELQESSGEDDADLEVDVEGRRTPPNSLLNQHSSATAAQVARLMLPVTPVRPTPFSALAAAAAAYSLQQPPQGWVHGHYPGPPVFPSFGGGLSGSPGKS